MTDDNGVPEAPHDAEPGTDRQQGPDVPLHGMDDVARMSRETNRDARLWAMFCHLAGLGGFVLPAIGCVIGPLIVWLIKKEDSPFIDEHGKEALNFQISMLIYGSVAGLLCFACIGFVLAPAVAIADLVFLIIAAIKANDGYLYRYPLTIRFVK